MQTQRLSGASTSGGVLASGGMLAAMAVLREIVAKDGWLGLYKGLGTQLVKGVLSSALMLATKEKLQRYTAILVRLAILMVQLFFAQGLHHVRRRKGVLEM
jgi:hypothetical protein